jgi:hypothetical protein
MPHRAGRREKLSAANLSSLKFAGSTVPADRKWEIYTICSEYGIIIIEDDPYYYLQYPDAAGTAMSIIPCRPMLHIVEVFNVLMLLFLPAECSLMDLLR